MNGQRIETTPTARVPVTKGFWCRDLVSICDLSPREVQTVLDLAGLMKVRPSDFHGALAGKQMAMFFEKPRYGHG